MRSFLFRLHDSANRIMQATLLAIKKMLALSAAVSTDVLEQRDAHGRYVFARGRHKYFGLGALVIFFALFSGYGMAHMLATMSNVSAQGACVAGVLWAMFQWCLERQIIMSIAHDSAWHAKAYGFFWRALLAILSASTMIYPFFVESNRAEIEVRVGELTQARLIQNIQSAHAAAGLPEKVQAMSTGEQQLEKLDAELKSDPPEMAALRQQAKQCWTRYIGEEIKSKEKIAQLSAEKARTETGNVDALEKLDQSINLLHKKLSDARRRCQNDESLVLSKLLLWKTEKTAEKITVVENNKSLHLDVELAKTKSLALEDEQSSKIALAAKAGFAADFAATWDMLKNDLSRRIQFIWWFVWFLVIELIAILVKFSSTTDVDARLNSDEVWLKSKIAHDLALRLNILDTARLQSQMQAKGQQAALHEDDGRSYQIVATHKLKSATFNAMAQAM